MTLEQITEIKAFLRSKGLDDDAIDGAMKSISFHEDTAQLRDSDDVKRGRDIMKFKPNPGKATLTQVGETQTFLGGDNRGLPIYQEDVDMIKKALPLAKRLIELQKTKLQEPEKKKPLSEMTPQEKMDYWDAKEEKDSQVMRTLRDTIDEVYDVNPEELNMGPDTTENINEISEEDRMKLPDRVKESMLRSRGIKKNENITHDNENKKTFEPREQWEENLKNVAQDIAKSGFLEEYYRKKTPEAADDDLKAKVDELQRQLDELGNKNISLGKDKMKESFEKTQEANICMGIHEDRKDPGDYYKYSNILKRMDDTHTRKNNDYGDAAYQGYKKFGPAYFLVQLHNKLSRLESLTVNSKTQMVKDESIDDTLLDMANYAVMYLESRHRND